MSIKKLAGQTVWYGMSNIIGRLIGSLLSPILTFLLGDDAKGMMDMGDFSILYAWIAVGNVIFTYGFETGYFRFVNLEGNKPDTVFRTTLSSLLLSTTLFCLLIILFRVPISNGLGMSGFPELIIIVALILGLDTITTIPFAKLRHEGRPKKYALVKVTGILSNLIFIIIFLYVFPKVLGNSGIGIIDWFNAQNRVMLIVLSNLIQNILVVLLLFKEFKGFYFRLSPTLWKKIFRYSSPMILIGLAGMVNEVLDRQFLQWFLPLSNEETKAQIGLYSANYKIAIFISLFIQAFRMGAEPFFFKESNNKDAQKTYALVMKWFVITLCIAFLFSSLFLDVLVLINNKGYQAGMYIIPYVLLANVFLGMYYNFSVWYKITNRMMWGTVITFVGAFLTILINWVYIPEYGITAPAVATLICYFSMAALAYVIGQKYYPIPYPMLRIGTYILTAVSMYLIQTILYTQVFSSLNIYLFKIISGILFIVIYGLIIIKLERVNVAFIFSKIKRK